MQMVRRHKRFLLLTLMLALFVSVFSQSNDSARYSKYPYIFILDENQKPSITDEQFYKVALKVIFPVDVYRLDTSQKSIKEFIQDVIPQINTDSLKPHAIMVKGSASPEGPYRWNQTLGKNRTAQVFNYINQHLKFPEEQTTINSTPENYQLLLHLMKEANDPSYRIVKSLVDKYYEAGMLGQLKQHLKRIDGGMLWRRLYKQYYSELRTARVVLFFRKQPSQPYMADPSQPYMVDPSQPSLAPSQPSLAPSQPYLAEPHQPYMADPSLAATPDSIAIELLPIEPFEGALPLFTESKEQVNPDVPYIPVRLYRRHILGIRTNLLYDFFYLPGHYWAPSPNVQLEYYPLTGHFTANLGFTGPYWHHWSRQQFWQIRDYVFEGRYYFIGLGQFIGPYVSAYVHTNIYGIGLSKTKGWEGEGLGGGAILGYTMNISRNKRWRLEFSLGFGYYRTQYDPYVYGNPKSTVEDGLYYYDYLGKKENFKERNHVFSWIGPTNLGVHLTYDLLYRRIQKKGISFNRSELYQRKKGGADE